VYDFILSKIKYDSRTRLSTRLGPNHTRYVCD